MRSIKEDISLIKFLDDIFLQAIEKNASDIHLEPYKNFYRIRLRIDGFLYEIAKVNIDLAQKFSVRLKIMAGLDIADRRFPQDGRFTFSASQNESFACRVNSCPVSFGEKIVIRILNPENVLFYIEDLGFGQEQRQVFLRYINLPDGLILVTGPTSSGKTVSLYTALNILNNEHKNILTVEDPIEIDLEGVNQVAINNRIGLTFPKVLRAFLRQDPDIIMIGEIRDLDTAAMAIKASQTGHLVLATLHANTTSEALTRLLNMGIAPFNLVSSIVLVVAQRLARKLCPFCKKGHFLSKEVLQKELSYLSEEDISIYRAEGCELCCKGYKGRIGIFELMPFSLELKQLLLERGNALDMTSLIKKSGGLTLREGALKKVFEGVTSLEEINRVVV